MYQEWTSLQSEILSDAKNESVLHKFTEQVGRDVSSSIVKSLIPTVTVGNVMGIPSPIKTDAEVKWVMEVLCYGLTLPLSEADTIKECMYVYCEWLSVFKETSKISVPPPVAEDPNLYARQILLHLHNLFVPRPQAALDLLNRQAVFCHRVLRVIHTQMASTQDMVTPLEPETWEALLKFLLGINDALLAAPLQKESIGDKLCERVLSVLFELWLVACSQPGAFPGPALWKTFRELCSTWRHHEPLVAQWHRVNVVLTAKVLTYLYGPDFPVLHAPDVDEGLVPASMSRECVTQCWFRFLHIYSNPVDTSHPELIGGTPKFLHMALTSPNVIDPHQHECLNNLPNIFHRAMKGVAVLVDAFLGLSPAASPPGEESGGGSRGSSSLKLGTSPTSRRAKSFTTEFQTTTAMSKAQSKAAMAAMKQKQQQQTAPPVQPTIPTPCALTLNAKLPLASSRSKVNSILHLFGSWLIEAALTGVKVHGSVDKDLSEPSGGTIPGATPAPLPPATPSKIDLGGNYEAGRAEACAALCRILASHKTREDIMPVYLARIYIALYYGLSLQPVASGQVLSNIIFNGCDLLRIDLDGVMILLPQIITALDAILYDLEPKFKWDDAMIPTVELRKASIHMLLSALCLPLHFNKLTIKPVFNEEGVSGDQFVSLKRPLIELLLRALTVETDSANTQMLLGGLMLVVEDLALYEEAEQQAAAAAAATQPSGGTRPSLTSESSTDTAHGLFGHAASLVCNRLMASWKVDLNIALAAIEVLSGLAKVNLNKPNALMCKRTLNWLCELIVYQCSRPPPLHSKDLHSMICAAFHCLTLWLVEHDYLMHDRHCLHAVLEVVELGISGAKSQNRASDVPKLKGEKQLKPVSQRVNDAAEGLLTVIMDHVGSFPPPCGPESVCSLLDEECLLKYCKDGGVTESGASPFKYYVLDGTTVVGLLEQPLGNEQDPLPTVTAIIRGPFGRHAWTMQLRHVPRHNKVASQVYLQEPPRPDPMQIGVKHNITHKYFPAVVDKVQPVQADKSIPPLTSTMSEHAGEVEKMKQFLQQQADFESKVTKRVLEERDKTPYPNPEVECKQPSMKHDFQPARLLLSHFGLTRLEMLRQHPGAMTSAPAVLALDNQCSNYNSDDPSAAAVSLQTELEQLDQIPCRTADTVHVFYVKAGQKMPFEILNNVSSSGNVTPTFLEFLRSLGWPVDVHKHAGWTGHTSTSWKIQNQDDAEECEYPGDTGGSLYDGRQQVLYWADISCEVAFVVPSQQTYQPMARRTSMDNASEKISPASSVLPAAISVGPAEMMANRRAQMPDRSKFLSLDLDQSSNTALNKTVSRAGVRGARTGACLMDTKLFVVWLENYEDHENFPAVDLLNATSTGKEHLNQPSSGTNLLSTPPINIIYIHALANGLFRIHMAGHTGRMHMAIPLVDGMVVSRRALGSMVRQTATNICRRKRLDNDSHQPPHVRRKLKIKDLVDKHHNHMSESEFYTSLFQETKK